MAEAPGASSIGRVRRAVALPPGEPPGEPPIPYSNSDSAPLIETCPGSVLAGSPGAILRAIFLF